MEIALVSKEILSVLRGALTQDRVYIPYSAQGCITAAFEHYMRPVGSFCSSRFHPYKLIVVYVLV